MSEHRKQIRELLAMQCNAMAALQLEMAAVLIGKGQDELRQHFQQSAEVLAKAAKELSA